MIIRERQNIHRYNSKSTLRGKHFLLRDCHLCNDFYFQNLIFVINNNVVKNIFV